MKNSCRFCGEEDEIKLNFSTDPADDESTEEICICNDCYWDRLIGDTVEN